MRRVQITGFSLLFVGIIGGFQEDGILQGLNPDLQDGLRSDAGAQWADESTRYVSGSPAVSLTLDNVQTARSGQHIRKDLVDGPTFGMFMDHSH